MDVVISQVKKQSDISRLYVMIEAMAKTFGDSVALTSSEFQEYFNNGQINAVIALDGEQPVGYSIWNEGFHTYDGIFMYIDDIFVENSYRNQGIGSLLFSALKQVAIQNNYKNIEWLVPKDDNKLTGWYDSLGSKSLSKYEYRRLPRSSFNN